MLMIIDIDITTKKTGKDYFQGKAELIYREENEKRDFTFTISILDETNQEMHLVVRHKEKIFINVQDLNDLTGSELALFLLLHDGFVNTTMVADSEELESQESFEEIREHYEELGISHGIVARGKYYAEIDDPTEQSMVIQLFEDTQQ